MPAFTRESLRKRDFSRRRKCKEAGGCFSAKKNGAKRTLLRRGGEDEIRTHGCVNITAFPMSITVDWLVLCLVLFYLAILPKITDFKRFSHIYIESSFRMQDMTRKNKNSTFFRIF